MIINSFSFKDVKRKIVIDKVFLSKMNLLVGISGAGKTTIMSALHRIKRIASGYSAPGNEWEINFNDDSGSNIVWSGAYSADIELDEKDKEQAEITREKVIIDGSVIVDRSKEDTILYDNKLPVLDKHKSILNILRDDDSIKAIYKDLQSILIFSANMRNQLDESAISFFNEQLNKVVTKAHKTAIHDNSPFGMREINNLHTIMDIRHIIYFCSVYDQALFEDFTFLYTSIFNTVKEIKIKKVSTPSSISSTKKGISISLIMEDGSTIPQEHISSGMFKTMMILACLTMGKGNNVIMIDEIENGLGINCFPEIISELKNSSDQIIISTHHPRIINDISPESWKIVIRTNGKISAVKAEEIISSTSNHDPFIKLVNSCIFNSGPC